MKKITLKTLAKFEHKTEDQMLLSLIDTYLGNNESLIDVLEVHGYNARQL